MGLPTYEPTPLRTGYEYVVPQRCGKMFSAVAKGDGKVIGINDGVIVVEYKDGSQDHVETGLKIGVAAGVHYPHPIVSNVNVGDKVKSGDIIAYNSNFFKPDAMNGGDILWKAGILCKTAFMENSDTLLDSSAISEKMAERIAAQVIKVRSLVFEGEQEISDLVQVGDVVNPDTILCTIEDFKLSDSSNFSETSLATLRLIAGNTPRAKYSGKVQKIEVMYYGDIEDLSESLKTLVKSANKQLAKERKAMGLPPLTCEVKDSLRIDNKILEYNSVVAKVYILEDAPAGIGDKIEFASQMKSVIGRVMGGVNRTESGEDLDALFGYIGVLNRIVNSPITIGTTNTLLKVLSKKVSDIYFS